MLMKIRRVGNIIDLGGRKLLDCGGGGGGGGRGGGVQDAGNVMWMRGYLKGSPGTSRHI